MSNETIILEKINITPLLDAQKTFVSALAQSKSKLERDGTILRFEFTYELCWKILRRILAFKGVNASSPRDVFREAARLDLIEDPKIWFDFIKKRNLTIHTYNEECADEIFESLPEFKEELEKLVRTITHLQV
jgi:nucleotidyltransferase substrate binding protein (TIGR01987 family)